MGIGGGIGVSGGPIPPGIRESETQAFTEVEKKYVLSMLPADTMEVIPFTQFTYHETFKYDTSASKPLIMPLLFIRSSETESEASTSWQQNFQDLVDNLPSPLKERFAEEGQKPFAERDPSFVALSNVLVGLAKAEAWLNGTGQPIEVGSPQESLWQQNVALPYLALQGAVLTGNDLSLLAESYLHAVGHGFEGFEAGISQLAELSEAINVLDGLLSSWSQGGLTHENRMEAISLANTLGSLAERSALLVLGNTLSSLESLAFAIGNDRISPSIVLGLAMIQAQGETPLFGAAIDRAAQGVLSAVFAMGSFGPRAELAELELLRMGLGEIASENQQITPELAATLEKYGISADTALDEAIVLVDTAISEKKLEPQNVLSALMEPTFSTLAQVVLGAVAISAILIANGGLGFYSGDAHDRQGAKIFTLEVALVITSSSRVVDTIFGRLARAAGADEATESRTAQILKMLAMLYALLAALSGNPQELMAILGTLSQTMNEGLEGIEVSDEEPALLLEQGKIAFSEEDGEGFTNSLAELFATLGISPEEMEKDTLGLRQFAELLGYTFTSGMDIETNRHTNISQAM